MGTSEIIAGGGGGHTIQGGVEILLVASWYENQDKLSSNLKGHLAQMPT